VPEEPPVSPSVEQHPRPSSVLPEGDPFPYRVRPAQVPILEEMSHLVRSGGPLLLHAPTGTGKTVAVLAPLLAHAEAADHRIVYLVRTHSQSAQVLRELRALVRRRGRPALGLTLEGRHGRCLLWEDVEEMGGATPEEYGKLCADRKRATEQHLEDARQGPPLPEPEGARPPPPERLDLLDLDGCPYYGRLLTTELSRWEERLGEELPAAGEFTSWAREQSLCPYELAKRLARRARVIVAPYVFFFHPHIRRSLWDWMGVAPSQVDLVVDEAHNVAEMLRDLGSLEIREETVRRALAEVVDRGDFPLANGVTAQSFLKTFLRVLSGIVEECSGEEEGLLPPGILEERLLAEVGSTTHHLEAHWETLVAWGEALREDRRRARRLPRSYVRNLALGYLAWLNLEAPERVKVARRQPERGLVSYALDVSELARPVRECHLSVHMSGTLAPLEEYRDSLGLPPESRCREVPPAFPPENRPLFYSRTVSTRHEDLRGDPEALPRLLEEIVRTVEALPVKCAIFFPSHQLLERLLKAGLARRLPQPAAIESRGLSTPELWRLVEGFRRSPESRVLLGVMGGRIAEGIDFPEETLEAVVLVGIPYPAPTARRQALMRFLDRTTGKGWEYCLVAPALRAMQQALGRMIRSETDRGIGVILDLRAPQFERALGRMTPLHDLAGFARSFYNRLPGGRETRAPSPPGRISRRSEREADPTS